MVQRGTGPDEANSELPDAWEAAGVATLFATAPLLASGEVSAGLALPTRAEV